MVKGNWLPNNIPKIDVCDVVMLSKNLMNEFVILFYVLLGAIGTVASY